MSARRTWVVVLLVVFLVILALVLGTGYYLFMGRPVAIQQDTVVEVILRGDLNELPPENPFAQIFEPDGPSIWDLEHAFRYAAQDDRISGIYLEIHPLVGVSWAQIEELREYIQSFRESEKPVHALLAVDIVGEKELYLGSSATSMTVNPDAAFLVNGLMAEVAFFKGTMDKLGIRPQFIQFKEYKSSESFTRETMTPEIREMYESILRDLQGRFVAEVAREREIDPARLEDIISRGLVPATVGMEEGLVDALGYTSEVLRELGLKDEPQDNGRKISAGRYASAARDRFQEVSRYRVALLGGVGSITAGESSSFANIMGASTFSRHLREIRKDDTFKGVILRVDSPGGSAVGSDMIWKEVELLQEAGKPVIVSMSGVAGSGGYYISMGARQIISQPSTITGSIGVIGGKFDLSGLYNWLGVTYDRVKLAPNADFFSPVTPLSPYQLRQFENWMQVVYENFVSKAAEGRGMEYEELESRARGRIYTGAQARELGLIDQTGGLRTAVAEMRKALELPEEENVELVRYPRQKTFWEAVLGGEFFGIRQPSFIQVILEELRHFSNPGAWLLTPEAEIY